MNLYWHKWLVIFLICISYWLFKLKLYKFCQVFQFITLVIPRCWRCGLTSLEQYLLSIEKTSRKISKLECFFARSGDYDVMRLKTKFILSSHWEIQKCKKVIHEITLHKIDVIYNKWSIIFFLQTLSSFMMYFSSQFLLMPLWVSFEYAQVFFLVIVVYHYWLRIGLRSKC